MKEKYIRDPENPGAVLNTDVGALQAYKLQKLKHSKTTELSTRVDGLEKEVYSMQDKLNRILELLSK